MRDIRDDLRARRAAAIGRYADAMHHFQVEVERLHKERQQASDAFESEKATLDAMLAIEEQRLAQAEVGGAAPVGAPTISLRDFIVMKIQSEGPIDKEALSAAARESGFPEGGRAFNMTLQNVASGGRVQKLPDGRYVHANAPDTLFGMGRSTGEAPMTAQ